MAEANIEKVEELWDIIIIGAGTAGLTAALYALRAGQKVLVIEGKVQGGQIIITPEVENYPGIPKVSGFDYVQGLFNQVKGFGLKIVYGRVNFVDLESEIKTITTPKAEYKGKSVILATGVAHRKLGVEGEAKYTGRGVSYCATCDGAFYKEKPIAVVGGGNTALEDALYLAKTCSKVYLIHRRDCFRGEQVLADSVKAVENIEIIYNTVVEEIIGDKKVSSAKLKNRETGELSEIEINGIFIAVGLVPDNDVFKDIINLDEAGYVIADEFCHTNLEGVFVAGDTRTKPLRQLVTAASDGAVAATEAVKYVSMIKNEDSKTKTKEEC